MMKFIFRRNHKIRNFVSIFFVMKIFVLNEEGAACVIWLNFNNAYIINKFRVKYTEIVRTNSENYRIARIVLILCTNLL